MKILLVVFILTIIIRRAFSAPVGSTIIWKCYVGDVECKNGDSGGDQFEQGCKGNNLNHCVKG